MHRTHVPSRIVSPCEWLSSFTVGAIWRRAIVDCRPFREGMRSHVPSHVSLLGCPVEAPCKSAVIGLDVGVKMFTIAGVSVKLNVLQKRK
jgi:hypothetical protein